MPLTSIMILHGGSVLESTLFDYLFRVVLYLFAFGGVAVIIFWVLEVVSAIHSEIVEKPSGGENDL